MQKTLLKKYKAKKASTKGRIDGHGKPIEFRLSFDEWCELWTTAGRLPNRDWVISRHNDLGHYEVGNVFIQHNLHNVRDGANKVSTMDRQITDYAIKHGYKIRIVKNMVARGQLSFG